MFLERQNSSNQYFKRYMYSRPSSDFGYSYAFLFSLPFIGSAIILFLAGIAESSRVSYYFIFSIISVYLYFECIRFLERDLPYKLLAPPVLASVMYFFQSHILSAIWGINEPQIFERFSLYVGSIWTSMAECAPFVAVGAFMMWRGFNFAERPSFKFGSMLLRNGYVRQYFIPNIGAALALQAFSLLVTITSIALGIFGFASSVELRLQNVQILQFMSISSSLGLLSLLLLFGGLFNRIKNKEQPLDLWIVCILSLGLQLAIGALAGFKSQLVIPFVIVAIAYYIVNQRILFLIVPVIAVSVIFSYAIIEPYRAYLTQNQLYGSSNVSSLINVLDQSSGQREASSTSDASVYTQIVMRSDISGMTAVGLSYAEGREENKEISDFLVQSIVMAPIYAYIPRAIWPEKPSFSTGVWFNQTVLGAVSDQSTSVNMGPITSLYLIGGWLGVVLGFFVIGYFQGLVYHGVMRHGAGGVLVFLSTASNLAQIPGDLGPALQGMLQIGPIMMIGQFFLLRPHAAT